MLYYAKKHRLTDAYKDEQDWELVSHQDCYNKMFDLAPRDYGKESTAKNNIKYLLSHPNDIMDISGHLFQYVPDNQEEVNE